MQNNRNFSILVVNSKTRTETSQESPYACAFCPKRFSENSTLRKHEATHGAKNYTCPVCERGFVRKVRNREMIDGHSFIIQGLSNKMKTWQKCHIDQNKNSNKHSFQDYLAKHMATHRQTFRCAACAFVCHARSDIEAHVAAEHRDT